ncbi:MAG: cytochrome c-type biogenesis protein CcmH [Thermoleophilia bacterium]|nr:cytochrome c-type biogenesis protein CcmH [Thermoleophilia bacterium]
MSVVYKRASDRTRRRCGRRFRRGAVVGVAGVLTVATGTFGVQVTLASQAKPTVSEVSALVMCPTCDTTLDRSDSPAAERMRILVREHIKAGETRDEVLRELVQEYGGDESVLATPPRHGSGLIAWLPPAIAGLVLAAVGGMTIIRWRRAGALRLAATDGAAGAVSEQSVASHELDSDARSS